MTLAGLARETSTIRLGTLMTSATFRHPGPLAITVAGVDQMSGGRVELGLGAGWYDAEHAAYGIPFPEHRGAVRPARGAAGGDHRAVGEHRRLLATTATHYRVVDSPGLPKPVQATAADHRSAASGSEADPRAGRPVRRRVQPAVRPVRGGPRAERPGPAGLRGDRPRPGHACGSPARWCSASAPTTPRSPPGRGDRPRRRHAAPRPPRRHGRTRWSTRSAATPSPARPGSTSRRWTSRTSTTCGSSRRRSCPECRAASLNP